MLYSGFYLLKKWRLGQLLICNIKNLRYLFRFWSCAQKRALGKRNLRGNQRRAEV